MAMGARKKFSGDANLDNPTPPSLMSGDGRQSRWRGRG